MKQSICLLFFCFLFFPEIAPAQYNHPDFPVEPEIFVDSVFNASEGIAFNGEGDLFVTANRSLWKVNTARSVEKIAELYSNLGIAGIGERDLLVADFGPTNAFRHGRNSDGIIWRITPGGEKTQIATGIGDPNFIVVRKDRTLLVSDDATSDIYKVTLDGNVELFTTAVNHPNGLVFNEDESILYVAETFTNIRPIVSGNAVWSIKLDKQGMPVRDADLLVRTGPDGANDGLAMDNRGRLYIAANREGKIWRYDPNNMEMTLIAENLFGAGSIAFGEGDFDHNSIYVTTTFAGGRGGKIWKIAVGAEGAPLNR